MTHQGNQLGKTMKNGGETQRHWETAVLWELGDCSHGQFLHLSAHGITWGVEVEGKKKKRKMPWPGFHISRESNPITWVVAGLQVFESHLKSYLQSCVA